jgi:hypothetical protein
MARYIIRVARSAGIIALFVVTALLGLASGVFFAYAGDLPAISALDPVNVIIPVNQDILIAGDCGFYTLHGQFHVFHEKGIMQVLQLWPEKRAGLFKTRNPPLYEKYGDKGIYPEGRCQGLYLFRIRSWLECPAHFRGFYCVHKIYNFAATMMQL